MSFPHNRFPSTDPTMTAPVTEGVSEGGREEEGGKEGGRERKCGREGGCEGERE